MHVKTVNYDGAIFETQCVKCGRFVKMDEFMKFKSNIETGANEFIWDEKQYNATCFNCGRTKTLFKGYF